MAGCSEILPLAAGRGEDEAVAADLRLACDQFPRSSQYHPDWVVASASGGANALWMTEWLTAALALRPGMRVLDLGCGRAASSIFLHREFGVQVWAVDLWFSATENQQRIRDAGSDQGVFPLQADARALPFAPDFFDAVVCVDSFHYFATDDLFLNYLTRFVKVGGAVGLAGAGLMRDIDEAPPEHLRTWWTPDVWSLHSAAWWRRHWHQTGLLDIVLADTLPEGWQRWLDWHRVVAPDNLVEIEAVQTDQGRYLGYVRVVGHRHDRTAPPDHIVSVPAQYTKTRLLRSEAP